MGTGIAIVAATASTIAAPALGVLAGVGAGAFIDVGVQLGFQSNDEKQNLTPLERIERIDSFRVLKTGAETGLLTLVPCCKGFKTDATMAFGTSMLWNEATIATSMFDGAFSCKQNKSRYR